MIWIIIPLLVILLAVLLFTAIFFIKILATVWSYHRDMGVYMSNDNFAEGDDSEEQ